MENGSYVYLFRKFGRCEWYTDVSAKVLFIHCLIKANWRDKESHGTLIKRGTFLTSIRRLSHETGLTDKQVRGGLSRLEKAEAIIYKPRNLNWRPGIFSIWLILRKAPSVWMGRSTR